MMLEVRDLHVTYPPDVQAVRGVSFSLDAGKTLGVAGESGSGKSTVGLSVLRLLPSSARVTGEILLDGEDVLRMNWGRLRAVRWADASIVFQGAMNSLNPVRTIGEQIREPILLHEKVGTRAARERTAELLDAVGVPARRSGAYPHELSGGQRQRVMIAMALACRPNLIIADEPTTALDVIVQAQILRLITDLVHEAKISMIMISHDLTVLADTCDRLAVMYAGRIVEIGASQPMAAAPRHPYTQALSSAIPAIGDPGYSARLRKICSSDTRKSCAIGGDGALTLEARDLSVTFPPRRERGPARAVDGVNLTVGAGEIVALVGESGCGKSTLARAFVGLVRPTSGEVRYRGTTLRYSSKALKRFRRYTQLVLQDPAGALNPRQNVFDAVAEGPRLHGLRAGLPERVETALSQAGLRPPEQFVARYPYELSGGQQQRVVIAGALALEPSVIVADEPVASLDASVRGEILRLLLDLRASLGLSALVVSHDLGLAWNIADRVAVMYLGRIVEQGTVEDVLLRPRHPYTQALISVLPGTDAEPVLLRGEPPDPSAIPAGCRFHPRCQRFAALEPTDERRALCTGHPLPILDADQAGVACHLADPVRDDRAANLAEEATS
jgi:oligopeptide/dipeptide ABC transporter ATP-binding protein